MRGRADERREMRLQTFAQAGSLLESTAQSLSAQLLQGLIEHCQYSYEIENDKMMEHTGAALVGLSSNHTVLYGSLAFDLIPVEAVQVSSTSSFRLVFRHILVDPAYRGRCCAYKLLRHVLLEVDRLGHAIQSISAVCRSDSALVPKFLELGFAFDADMAADVLRSVNAVAATSTEPALSVYTADLSSFQFKVNGVLEFISTRLR
eukprot:gene16030-11473_t